MDALITFLRARLDEDQKVYGSLLRIMDLAGDLDPDGDSRVMCTKILADVAAKRQIIDQWLGEDSHGWHKGYEDAIADVLRLLALPFAGHPDYREEWRA